MTQKNVSSKRAGKQRYSAGTLAVTLLIFLAYWWLTGSLPSSEAPQDTASVANTPAIATGSEAATIDATPPEETAAGAAQANAKTPTAEPIAVATDAAVVTVSAAEESTAATATETPLPAATPTVIPMATAPPLPSPTATTAPTPTALPTNPPRAGPRGLVVITLDELPPEALETIDLIMQGGPFPFDRDGITFQNRERLLPNEPRGYYREYTVITPGSRDRGARRIVAGADGELYYTDDHYASFTWIVLP